MQLLIDCALAETSSPLDHLDLVAVGVRDEEEPRQRPAVMLEVAQWSRREALALEASMLGVDVIDDDGEMAVAGAERIGFLRSKLTVSSTSNGEDGWRR